MTPLTHDVLCSTNIENAEGDQTEFEFILRFASEKQFERMRYELSAYDDKVNRVAPKGGWRVCDVIEPVSDAVPTLDQYDCLDIVNCIM